MKRLLLNNLKNDTYCRLLPSKTHGVGVVAIREIPKNINPFKRVGPDPTPVKISEKELKALPSAVQRLVRDFSQKEEGNWYVPNEGFNGIDISFYINHSKKPNMKICCSSSVINSFVFFLTIRPIKKGEELLINYDS